MKVATTACIALLLLVAPLALASPAVTVRAIELKAKPASDAKVVISLPAEAPVDVVTRQGAWVELKSGRTTGWAKLFDIRDAQAAAAGTARKGDGVADTLNLAMGTRGASVTTGVRGLDADMLERATPNAQEFSKMTSYARSKAEADAFARSGRLRSREVSELGATAKTAGTP
ncbi:MAG: hypothetical protein ABI440_09505 [Casimicrobiaceae bacterium]